MPLQLLISSLNMDTVINCSGMVAEYSRLIVGGRRLPKAHSRRNDTSVDIVAGHFTIFTDSKSFVQQNMSEEYF